MNMRRQSENSQEEERLEPYLRDRFNVRFQSNPYQATIYFDGEAIAMLKLASDNIEDARKLVKRVIKAYEEILKVYS